MNLKSDLDIRNRSINGFAWKFMEKIGSQGISLIVQIILARILLPEEFGIVGYLTLFINLSDVFIQQGFTTALIQKKDADESDFSSVFFANLFMSVVIYGVLVILAPFISAFYNEPELTHVMRVMSLTVIFGAFSAVHNAIMAKNLEFKKSFFRGLANILVYAVVGISMACMGFGVWSLVFAKLAGLFVGAIVLWITVKWVPHKIFSVNRVRSLFKYSSKVLGTNLLNTLFNNINSIIIGRFYTSADMGYYQRGQSIPQAAMQAVDGSMTEVMYPTFSLIQDDLGKLKAALRRSMKLSTYVVFPILIGLMVVSRPLTIVLLTEKWLPSVPYMQLTCVICLFWPLAARSQALNAMGLSNVTLKLSIIGKILTLVCLLLLARFGVIYIMYGNIFTSIITFFISSHYINEYIHYSIWELMKDLCPNLILSLVMGVLVHFVSLIGFANIVTLVVQILVGIAIYIVGSLIFKLDSLSYLYNIMKPHIVRIMR